MYVSQYTFNTSSSGRLRSSRRDCSDVTLHCSREGILKRANGGLAAGGVSEDREIGIEQRASCADGDIERNPVSSCRRELVINVGRREPFSDGFRGLS